MFWYYNDKLVSWEICFLRKLLKLCIWCHLTLTSLKSTWIKISIDFTMPWGICKTEELICWIEVAKSSFDWRIASVRSIWKLALFFVSWMINAALLASLYCLSRCRRLLPISFGTELCSKNFLFSRYFLTFCCWLTRGTCSLTTISI